MKRTYDIVSVKGTEIYRNGIKCLLCYTVSWEPAHVDKKYCPHCEFFHSNDWKNDEYIKLLRRTDQVFAARLLRGRILYWVHNGLVNSLLAITRPYRWLKRLISR